MIHENFCTDKISSQFLISVTDFTIHESHLCEDFASGSCYFYILQLERLKVWKIIKVFLVLFKLLSFSISKKAQRDNPLEGRSEERRVGKECYS